MRKPVLVLVPVVALALAACGGGPTPSTGGPTPTVTVTVTPTPTPEEPSPDFGFTFFEEGQIGATFAQLSEQLHYPVAGIDECPYYGPVWNTEIATTYAFTDVDNPGGGIVFFYTNRFLASDDAAFPRNAEGVGVGSTQDEVLAAYPDALVEEITDIGAGPITRITVDDPDSDSKYAFGISQGSAVVDLLQWGPEAGGQWSHLCGGF